jgi:DNA-binding MarR family transcriptional regulator
VYGGPLTLGALADAEQVRPPTMTKLVAAMEEAGLVSRETDAADRRVVRISATTKGKRILEEGRDRRSAVIAESLAALPDADLADIAAALDAIEEVAGTPNKRSLTI